MNQPWAINSNLLGTFGRHDQNWGFSIPFPDPFIQDILILVVIHQCLVVDCYELILVFCALGEWQVQPPFLFPFNLLPRYQCTLTPNGRS